jgi:uncharacterized protein (TIGR02145 family)
MQEKKMKSKTEKFTDPRDGKIYKTIKIGEQVWMAENLNFECDGSVCYDNDPKNAEKYGRLYNWETAKKACPPGWHLPSNWEWDELVDFAGGEYAAGKRLKAKSGWDDSEGISGNGTDKYGFSALSGGYGNSSGGFGDVGNEGYWWSANEYGEYSDNAYRQNMSYLNEYAYWDDYGLKSNLFSVRCVQDYPKRTFTDPRDGKTYRIVKIGNQVWMAENLNFKCEESKYYDFESSNAEKYGRLYDWETAMEVCPPGWHLPSKEEWDELLNFAGGEEIAGKNLKARNGWNEDGNGTDKFGFSALPGGDGSPIGFFDNVGNNGYWWSANEDDSHNAYYRGMDYDRDDTSWDVNFKSVLFSVRCVQDQSVDVLAP